MRSYKSKQVHKIYLDNPVYYIHGNQSKDLHKTNHHVQGMDCYTFDFFFDFHRHNFVYMCRMKSIVPMLRSLYWVAVKVFNESVFWANFLHGLISTFQMITYNRITANYRAY